MLSSKTIYSKYFTEYQLSQLDLEQLQHTLFEMLRDFKFVCDKYNIDYMLCGGTLLGAIRHKGFIPWDDDIDVMMLREEYEKFAPLFRQEFSEKYLLADPGSDKKYITKSPKIFLKDSVYTELSCSGIGKFNMIFLDIFPVENVPLPGFGRKLRSLVYDFAFKASSLCADYKYPSPDIIEKGKNVKEVREYYNFRRRLGFLFSCFGGMSFYLRVVEKLAKYNKTTGYKCIPSGISYSREIFETKLFTELTTAEFCGDYFKIPANYDAYLRNLYRDYMQIPAPEKREIHTAVELKFPDQE